MKITVEFTQTCDLGVRQILQLIQQRTNLILYLIGYVPIVLILLTELLRIYSDHIQSFAQLLNVGLRQAIHRIQKACIRIYIQLQRCKSNSRHRAFVQLIQQRCQLVIFLEITVCDGFVRHLLLPEAGEITVEEFLALCVAGPLFGEFLHLSARVCVYILVRIDRIDQPVYLQCIDILYCRLLCLNRFRMIQLPDEMLSVAVCIQNVMVNVKSFKEAVRALLHLAAAHLLVGKRLCKVGQRVIDPLYKFLTNALLAAVLCLQYILAIFQPIDNHLAASRLGCERKSAVGAHNLTLYVLQTVIFILQELLQILVHRQNAAVDTGTGQIRGCVFVRIKVQLFRHVGKVDSFTFSVLNLILHRVHVILIAAQPSYKLLTTVGSTDIIMFRRSMYLFLGNDMSIGEVFLSNFRVILLFPADEALMGFALQTLVQFQRSLLCIFSNFAARRLRILITLAFQKSIRSLRDSICHLMKVFADQGIYELFTLKQLVVIIESGNAIHQCIILLGLRDGGSGLRQIVDLLQCAHHIVFTVAAEELHQRIVRRAFGFKISLVLVFTVGELHLMATVGGDIERTSAHHVLEIAAGRIVHLLRSDASSVRLVECDLVQISAESVCLKSRGNGFIRGTVCIERTALGIILVRGPIGTVEHNERLPVYNILHTLGGVQIEHLVRGGYAAERISDSSGDGCTGNARELVLQLSDHSGVHRMEYGLARVRIVQVCIGVEQNLGIALSRIQRSAAYNILQVCALGRIEHLAVHLAEGRIFQALPLQLLQSIRVETVVSLIDNRLEYRVGDLLRHILIEKSPHTRSRHTRLLTFGNQLVHLIKRVVLHNTVAQRIDAVRIAQHHAFQRTMAGSHTAHLAFLQDQTDDNAVSHKLTSAVSRNPDCGEVASFVGIINLERQNIFLCKLLDSQIVFVRFIAVYLMINGSNKSAFQTHLYRR